MDNNSLAHTKWDCKYHLVFAPKYSRQVIYKDIKADVGQILGTLCRRKGIEIIEAQCMPDHIHMLVSIPPKYSVSEAYIQNQIKEDLEYDQMSIVEYIDPFTGEPVKKNKK